MNNQIKRLFQVMKEPENLIIVIGVVVAAILAYSGIRNNDVQQALAAILSILGALAVAQVITGYETIKRDKQIEALLSSLQRKCLHSRLDPNFKDFRSYCSGAQEIFLCALSLGFAVGVQRFFFQERLQNGCNFKLLIVDPDLPDEAFGIIAEHDERGDDPKFKEFLRNEIRASIRFLERLRDDPDRTGHLEIRTAKGLPVFTITIVNPTQETGKMRIEPRPYKQNLGARPYFELHRNKPADHQWYDFFFQHYYVMLWDDSKVIVKY